MSLSWFKKKLIFFVVVIGVAIVILGFIYKANFYPQKNEIVVTYPRNNIVQLYYNYIIDNIAKSIKKNNLKMNVYIDDNLCIDMGATKQLKLHVNYEHTLVKKDGRGVDTKIFGNILNDENEPYLVRLAEIDKYNNSDFVIDYSMPNLINVKTSKAFDAVSNKTYYIPSIVYDKIRLSNNRNLSVVTTFFDRTQPRREALAEKLKNSDVGWVNMTGYFTYDEIQQLMLNTKILVNIHQTDHHHTFEELRVLPAIMNGVIVVAEYSPLIDHIPYHEYIVWSKYSDMADTVKHVLANYDEIYDKFYGEKSNIYNIISKMQDDADNSINAMLIAHTKGSANAG